MKFLIYGSIVIFLSVSFSGCTNPGFKERKESTERFQENLRESTSKFLEEHSSPFSISNVISFARSRTLKLTQQNLEQKLATISRNSAFSAFLPQVNVSYQLQNVRNGQMPWLQNSTLSFSSATDITSATLTQPVFTPVAWLMFAEARYGVRIRDIAKSRAEELLDSQVAGIFYQMAVSQKMISAYQTQFEASQALTNQLTQLHEQGFILDAEKARGNAKLAADFLKLRQAHDSFELAKANLCDVLQLCPFAKIEIEGDSLSSILSEPWMLKDAEGKTVQTCREDIDKMSIEELVWQTLVNRKELYAGDQMIEMRRVQIMKALAEFLPNIGADLGKTRLSADDVLVKFSNASMSGVWSVFQGFQSVNNYLAAKAVHSAEIRQQEDRMLAAIVSTMEAWLNRQQSSLQLAAALAAKDAARLDYDETKLRFENGQETMSELLDKLTVRDAAFVQAAAVEYSAALSEIILRQVMGIPLFDFEKEKTNLQKEVE